MMMKTDENSKFTVIECKSILSTATDVYLNVEFSILCRNIIRLNTKKSKEFTQRLSDHIL